MIISLSSLLCGHRNCFLVQYTLKAVHKSLYTWRGHVEVILQPVLYMSIVHTYLYSTYIHTGSHEYVHTSMHRETYVPIRSLVNIVVHPACTHKHLLLTRASY